MNPCTYRGYVIGIVASPAGFRGVWRSSLDEGWYTDLYYVPTPHEAVCRACESIDLCSLIEAEEISLGRALSVGEVKAAGVELARRKKLESFKATFKKRKEHE